MANALQILRVAWIFSVIFVLWTTDSHAQIIRGGGGNQDSLLVGQTGQVPAGEDPVSATPQLDSGYPNPFNPSTQLRYVLPSPANVELSVYNMLGQQVRNLASGWQEAGVYQVQWDARRTDGSQLASGTYLIRLVVKNTVLTQTVVFHK